MALKRTKPAVPAKRDTAWVDSVTLSGLGPGGVPSVLFSLSEGQADASGGLVIEVTNTRRIDGADAAAIADKAKQLVKAILDFLVTSGAEAGTVDNS